MPINEATGISRGGLTPKQKKEQLAAIYGLSGENMTPTVSHDDIARMKQIIAAHESKNSLSGIGTKEFDLNNPPKLPYTHQEYPRLMYKGKLQRVANSAEEREEAEASGWSAMPPEAPMEASQEELDAASVQEAAAIDALLKNAKRKVAKG